MFKALMSLAFQIYLKKKTQGISLPILFIEMTWFKLSDQVNLTSFQIQTSLPKKSSLFQYGMHLSDLVFQHTLYMYVLNYFLLSVIDINSFYYPEGCLEQHIKALSTITL